MINYRLTFRKNNSTLVPYTSNGALNCVNMNINWSLSSSDLSYMMSSLNNLDYFYGNIDNLPFNTSLANFFRNCNSIPTNNLNLISTGNMCNVTNVSYMFSSAGLAYNLNLPSGDTSNIVDFSYMFNNCMYVNIFYLNNGNMINAKNCAGMFGNCRSSTTALNISSGDVGNVVNFSFMFYNSNSLCNNRLLNGDVSSGQNFCYMFGLSNNLYNLNLSKGDMSNAQDCTFMFASCNKLKNLNIDNGNTHNITSLTNMFSGCINLKDLYMSNGNIHNVTTITNMFARCYNIISIDVSNGSVENIIFVNRVFQYCNNLSTDSLQNIAKMCLNATNVTVSHKNLMNTNQYSLLNYTNKQINVTTVGQDLITQLQAAGGTTN